MALASGQCNARIRLALRIGAGHTPALRRRAVAGWSAVGGFVTRESGICGRTLSNSLSSLFSVLPLAGAFVFSVVEFLPCFLIPWGSPGLESERIRPDFVPGRRPYPLLAGAEKGRQKKNLQVICCLRRSAAKCVSVAGTTGYACRGRVCA